MPKEKIYDDSQLFDIEVGWSFGGTVQLGLITHDGRSLADWLTENAQPTDEDNDRHGHSLPVRHAQFTSLWSSLDRNGVNRAIKMLRKARDEAYGRDE